MSSLIEDLNTQITTLQKILDPSIETLSPAFQKVLENPHDLTALCALHNLINEEQNLNRFNKLKKRKLIEEINLNILLLIRENVVALAETNKIEIPAFIDMKKRTHTSAGKKLLAFIGMVALGTLLSFVDGASIIQGILGTVINISSVPSYILLPVQIVFAFIGVLAFYGFELNNIGKPLGIRAFDLGRVFKLYSKQSKVYEETFSLIEDLAVNKSDFTEEGLQELETTYSQLSNNYTNFKKKIDQAKNANANPSRWKVGLKKFCTFGAATVCGLLSAFLGAQTFPLLLPFVLGSTLAGGPIGLGISLVLMGICFLSSAILYVHIQKKAVDEFVNKASGTPSRSVEKLLKTDELIQKKQQHIDNSLEKTKKLLTKQKEEDPRPPSPDNPGDTSLAEWTDYRESAKAKPPSSNGITIPIPIDRTTTPTPPTDEWSPRQGITVGN